MRAAIKNLVARGFTATRSGGEAQADAAAGTACDIVGAAFFTTYKNVERIWLSRMRQPSSSRNPKQLQG